MLDNYRKILKTLGSASIKSLTLPGFFKDSVSVITNNTSLDSFPRLITFRDISDVSLGVRENDVMHYPAYNADSYINKGGTYNVFMLGTNGTAVSDNDHSLSPVLSTYPNAAYEGQTLNCVDTQNSDGSCTRTYTIGFIAKSFFTVSEIGIVKHAYYVKSNEYSTNGDLILLDRVVIPTVTCNAGSSVKLTYQLDLKVVPYIEEDDS